MHFFLEEQDCKENELQKEKKGDLNALMTVMSESWKWCQLESETPGENITPS